MTPAGWRMLNHSAHLGGMVELNQGVCAPGMRQNVDAEGTLRCLRALSFPSALSEEIAYADAGDRPGAPDHERWCGRWIEAGSIAYGVERWAFFDEHATEAAVDDLIVAKGSGRLAVSDVSKFRTACRIDGGLEQRGRGGERSRTASWRPSWPHDARRGAGVDRLPGGPLLRRARAAGHRHVRRRLHGARHARPACPRPTPLTNALYAVGESRATRALAGEFAQARWPRTSWRRSTP